MSLSLGLGLSLGARQATPAPVPTVVIAPPLIVGTARLGATVQVVVSDQ